MKAISQTTDTFTIKGPGTTISATGESEIARRVAMVKIETENPGAGKPLKRGRRAFLQEAFAGTAGVFISILMSGCSDTSTASPASYILLPTTNATKDKSDKTPASSQPGTTLKSASIITPAPPLSSPAAPSAPSTIRPPTATGADAMATTSASSSSGPGNTGSKILLVYFSRAGENYSHGGRTRLDVGNTEVVANLIKRLIGCDVYRIEATEPYSDNYDETVQRNVREQNANARPAITNQLASIEQYDTVLIGSPIWNVRAPMILTTFVESFDFRGKTIYPFVTYAVSGLGTTVRDYTAACPGTTIGEGLAVRGEEVREAGSAVETWLRRIKLLK